jgi:hypothetical protein
MPKPLRRLRNAFRELRNTVKALIALVVAGALLWFGYLIVVSWLHRDWCGGHADLRRHGEHHECVGVTDGSWPFADAFKGIEREISAENQRVDRQRGVPHVSVVMLMPLTPGPSESMTLSAVLEHIKGAYVAQRRANQDIGTIPNSPEKPLIKLLLANYGTNALQWPFAVREILDHVDGPDRVVAVTGLGASTTAAQQAMNALAQNHLPTVGSVITADTLPDMSKGLTRVSPTNRDEVAALLQHAKPAGKVFLIRDAGGSDLYTNNLAADFQRSYHGGPIQLETFTLDQKGDVAGNPFRQMRETLCHEHASTVFFAGRGKQLQVLLHGWPDQPCPRLNLHILTGDDGGDVDLTDPQVKTALRDGIDVTYAGLAYPGPWTEGDDFGGGYKPFRDTLARLPAAAQDSLLDGEMIMEHDANWTTITAIRNAFPDTSPNGVANQLRQLHGIGAVAGAGGRISLDPGSGNAEQKFIPLLTLDPGRGIQPAQ